DSSSRCSRVSRAGSTRGSCSGRRPRPNRRTRIIPVATTAVDQLHFTGNPEADTLIAQDPLALLIGFVLDQQVPLEKAFSSPLELKKRIGALDAADIAGMD